VSVNIHRLIVVGNGNNSTGIIGAYVAYLDPLFWPNELRRSFLVLIGPYVLL
jgi:hypothetical protein